jgi:hypothetical protein
MSFWTCARLIEVGHGVVAGVFKMGGIMKKPVIKITLSFMNVDFLMKQKGLKGVFYHWILIQSSI